MARPGGFTNQYPPSSDGFIPNGQPPQFNGRPPVYPEKAPRPMMMGQHLPNITNGNQQFSHSSSLSSQSSRDPSPVPTPTQLTAMHRLTPTATPPQMSPVPPQQQTYNSLGSVPTPNHPNVAQDYAASHQSGPNSSAYEQTNLNPHQPGIYRPPNTGNFPSSIRPQQMMAPNDPSRQTSQLSYSNQTSSIPSTTNSASSYSATSSPQRFASQYDQNRQPNAGIFPQGSQAQTNTPNYQGSNFRGSSGILGSSSPSLLASSSGPQGPPSASSQVKSGGVQSLAGPPIPRTNALGTLPRTEGTAAQSETLDRMAAYGHQPSPSRQQIPSSYNSPPQLSVIGQQAQAHESQPSPAGFSQQTQSDGMGPPSTGLTRPGMQNTQLGINQTGPGLQRIPPLGSGMFQSGSGMSPMPGMPSTGPGLGQSGMPPRPGMPASGPAMSSSGLGINQNGPGMPPTGPGLSQSGMPPRPGMPPSGTAMPSSGLGINQNGPGMPQNGPGLPISSAGFNQSRMPPGMPPSGPGMYQNGPGMPPSGPGMAPPTNRPPPTGISGGPSHLPGTNGYPQSTVPTSQLTNATYTQQQQQRQFQPPPTNQLHNDRFNQQQQMQTQQQQQQRRGPTGSEAGINAQLAGLSVAQQGFSKLWGADSYDLLQCRNILPPEKVDVPRVKLQQEFLDAVNCSPDIFRCTMTKIPETNSLLQKSRLPLGILIHPFKDLNHLAVIQCQSIVRCRACRTYINPFVYFVDHKRWKCNLCFRVNELPEEFQFDPVSKTYGDPSRRPEIKSSTIEFIAPSEYMLRPPQPAVYLFVLDVSCLAVESGYLKLFCNILLDELDKLPGDGRTQIGFITFDSSVHFYSLAEGLNQPQQMVVVDVEDVFLPCPDSLVSNLNEVKELARDLLRDLPKRFAESHDSHSALGAALQAAYKLLSGTGGRVTVFQSCLPNHGPGALVSREVPSARASKDVQHLNPATDFYKRLALDCSGQQIAVDLFIVNQQYCDLATLSGISQFSGGSIHHFPLFKAGDWKKADALEQAFRRYLTRKLGLEAVMRIRCSRGLAIHTFHGNFFVRSTDLLSLPNVNPDAGFGMQVSVEESLADLQNVCFQAALLYTSSKGERRIRVHTLCLPVVANLSDILLSADQQCIVGLLSKMAVDRSHLSSLADAREAFINVAVDVVSAYKVAQGHSGSGPLLVPHSLRLLPMYILALLKYIAFRTGASTRLDDRVFAMCQMKTLPLANLIQGIYPDMYPVHRINEQATIDVEGTIVPQPPRLQLTAEKLESSGAFLLDSNDEMILFIGRNISPAFCQTTFGVGSFQEIREDLQELPELETEESEALRSFVNYLQTEKSSSATLQIIRDDSQDRVKFYERLVEDRSEASLSYYEFLQHIKSNVK